MRIPKNKNKYCDDICYAKYMLTENSKTVGTKLNKMTNSLYDKDVDKKYYSEISLKSVGEGLKKIQKRD